MCALSQTIFPFMRDRLFPESGILIHKLSKARGRIHESILRHKSLLSYNLGDNWYSWRPPILRHVLIFLLNLGGHNRPPNLLRRVLTPLCTERDGGGHVVMYRSSTSFTTWTGVSWPFQTAPPGRWYSFESISLPSRGTFNSLRFAEGRFRKAHASIASCSSWDASLCRSEVFCFWELPKCSWIRVWIKLTHYLTAYKECDKWTMSKNGAIYFFP